MGTRGFSVLSAFALAVLVPVAPAEARMGRPPSPIAGTVLLHGCEIRPIDLVIQAERVELTLAGSEDGQEQRRPGWSRRAKVRRTRDPHVARFVVHGPLPDGLYQLRIGYPAERCGRVFWRGPFEGFAVPGDESVRIEGFAARTEVEVLDEAADAWVAAAALDFETRDRGGTSKRFRWRSTVPGAVGGELQIAARAFPTQGAFGACDEPEGGLLERIPVPIARDGWTEVPPIDFATLLDPDGVTVRGGEVRVGAAETGEVSPAADRERPETSHDIARGAPLHIRVVPRTAAGPACNTREQGVHGWALVGRIPRLEEVEIPEEPPPSEALSPWEGHLYQPPYTGGERQGLPTYGQVAYLIIGEHTLPPSPCVGLAGSFLRKEDPVGCAAIDAGAPPGLRIEPGAAIEPGMWFQAWARRSGGGGGGFGLSTFTKAISSLTTGAINAVGLALESLSSLYEEIKSAVKEVALDAIVAVPGLGQLCKQHGDDCAKLVEIGLNTGLAAAGLPPSIPDFDKLKDRGIEYLASQIESQTGVPSYLADKALAVAAEAVEGMAARRGGSDPKYSWVIPFLGFSPAYAELVLRQNDGAPLPSDLVLSRKGTDLYRGGFVPIPSAFPASGTLRLPMVLQPSLAGIPSPLCRAGLSGVTCVGKFPADSQAVCEDVTFNYQTRRWDSWRAVDCASWTQFSPVSIYYRDQWVSRKLDKTDCAAVWAFTRKVKYYGPIPILREPPERFRTGTVGFTRPRHPLVWSGWWKWDC